MKRGARHGVRWTCRCPRHHRSGARRAARRCTRGHRARGRLRDRQDDAPRPDSTNASRPIVPRASCCRGAPPSASMSPSTSSTESRMGSPLSSSRRPCATSKRSAARFRSFDPLPPRERRPPRTRSPTLSVRRCTRSDEPSSSSTLAGVEEWRDGRSRLLIHVHAPPSHRERRNELRAVLNCGIARNGARTTADN